MRFVFVALTVVVDDVRVLFERVLVLVEILVPVCRTQKGTL